MRLLVTSREPLDIAAERRYQVPLLERCRGDRALQRPSGCGRRDGRRGRDGGGRRSATGSKACPSPSSWQLRGRPCSRPRSCSRRLDSAPDLLDGARRDAPDRHHTLRATISWSHELLDDAERALFQQLSVFAGGCTLDSAAVVTQAGLDARLVRSSGRACSAPVTGASGCWRRFASSLRSGSRSPETLPRCRARHARHYLDLARVADEELTGPDHADAFARLAQEQDNIRAALTWAVASDPSSRWSSLRRPAGSGSCGASWMRGRAGSRRRWLPTPDLPRPVRRCSMRAGAIADARGDYGRAEAHYRVALQLRRDGGDLAGAVGALNNLGALAHSQARPRRFTLLVRAGSGARTRDRRRARHRNGAGEHGNRRDRERRACAGGRAARGEHCAQLSRAVSTTHWPSRDRRSAPRCSTFGRYDVLPRLISYTL